MLPKVKNIKKKNSHLEKFVNILKCVNCDVGGIKLDGKYLRCKNCKKKYQVVNGVPILLKNSNLFNKKNSKNLFEKRGPKKNLYKKNSHNLYEYICKNIPSTSGFLYKKKYLKNGYFNSYPIPNIDLPIAKTNKNKLLDLGCGWGRWVFASSKKNYISIGVDANINFLKLANAIARENDYNVIFILADIKKLPFKNNTFDVVFSYSVIQHFSFINIAKIFSQVRNVLKINGIFKFQTMNFFGIRNQFYLMKRLYRKSKNFDVYYYSITFMKKILKIFFSDIKCENCSFFTQARFEDKKHLNYKGKIFLYGTIISNFLFKNFKFFSDNVYFRLKK